MRLACFAIVIFAASSARAYENVARGALVDGSFTTSSAGDALMGELGGESAGIRIHERFVMQWDVLLALKAGVLGNEHPYLFLIGPRALAWVEGGYLIPRGGGDPFNGYVGVRASGTMQILGNPDVSQFNLINAADGTGGASARGAFRASAGCAWIKERVAFFATVFGQEELQAPTEDYPSYAFSELGVALRFDIERSVMASLEGLVGTTPTRSDPRGFVDQTMRAGAYGSFRKIFGNGMWLGASVSIERDTDQLVYGNGSVFDTGNAPIFSAMLTYGVRLWKPK